MYHKLNLLRWTVRFCAVVFLLLPAANLQAQSTNNRITQLTARLNQLPENAPPESRCMILAEIAQTHERSKDLETAKNAIEYRLQIRELCKKCADNARTDSIRYPNEYQLQLFDRLAERSPEEAAEIWEKVVERAELKALIYQRQYEKAIGKAKELNRFFRDHFGDSDYLTAVTAADHDYFHFYLLRTTENMEEIFKEAVRVTSKVKHEHTYEVIDLSMRLVSLYNRRKEYSKSIKILEKCHSDAVAMYGPEDRRTLSLQYTKSIAHVNLGEINKARETLLEIHRIVNRNIIDNPSYLTMFVNAHLATIKMELVAGNYARALTFCDTLYSRSNEYTKLDVPHEWLAENLMYRTELLIAIDDLETLKSNVQKLEAHLSEMKLGWVRDRAKLEIAKAYLVMGELKRSEKYLNEIKDSKGILSVTSARSFLAQINRAKGNHEEALNEFQNLLKIGPKGDQREFDSVELLEQLGLTYRAQKKYEEELDCMQQCLELQLQEHGKRIQHLSLIDKLDTTYEVYKRYHSVLQASFNQTEGFDTDRAFGQLLKIQSVCNERPLLSSTDYTTQLPKGSAVIQFLVRATEPAGDQDDPESNRELVYSAFIIQRGATDDKATVSWMDIGKASDINASMQNWKQAITECLPPANNRGIRKVRAKAQLNAATAGEKFQQPLRPLFNKISKDIQNLVVCPAGVLWDVPWNGLKTEKNGPYLLESFLITNDSDCYQAMENLSNRQQPIQKRKLTLVYDVDFGPEGNDDSKFGPLPQTKFEAEKVMADWENPVVDGFHGESAIENKVIESLKTANIAYFATHVHSINPISEAKPTSKDDASRYRQVLQQYQNEIDAFTHQSIILSSVNEMPPSETRTVQQILGAEILASDYGNLDLVVLSSCNSAGGTNVSQLGNCGIQRAFRLAGSKTVIGSLWPVEDKATKQLMSEFSERHFQQGKSASESMRMAILKQMKTQPFHMWASWTILGR